MCGRFYAGINVLEVLKSINNKFLNEFGNSLYSDILPSDRYFVITKEDNQKNLKFLKWGLKGKNGNLIINARCESLTQKKMFSSAVRERRCIVPASLFYEWNGKKEKFEFFNNDILYMAGIYDIDNEGEKFVIITTEANDSVKDVHDRMPLIFDKDDAEKWLEGNSCYELLKKTPDNLKKTSINNQLSLF